MADDILAGVSPPAETIRELQREQTRHRNESVTLSNHEVTDRLMDVFHETFESHNDETAVSQHTVTIAREFLEAIDWAPELLSISGEPDGHIELEWYAHPRCILTVSIAPDRMVYWAALIGGESTKGKFYFRKSSLDVILHYIERVRRGA